MKDKFKRVIKKLVKKLPYFKNTNTSQTVPPGHFYSPVPSLEEIKLKEKELFENIPRNIPGIDLNDEHQLKLLQEFKLYYDEQPFPTQKTEGFRYFFECGYLYPYSDALSLYCMMRHYRPKRIIEVGGSGYSSCLILDINERFFNNTLSCICIEPRPYNILSLIKENEEEQFQLIQQPVQDMDLAIFQKLSHNDILFIDSTHVSKINSDVNYLIFQVLPSLASGVLIHFHDIFYPFEYPKEVVYRAIESNVSWNEIYMLRAFLEYNHQFKIEFFNHYLQLFYPDLFLSEMPLFMKTIPFEDLKVKMWTGGSIWLRKL
jgi:predicted O-methyltransferase YrrM